MSKPIIASDADFGQLVLESEIPVLVDFWAPWCGPCRMIAPVIEELSREYSGSIRVVKLNTDENPETAMTYHIMGIPTLGIFLNGQMVDQIVGVVPKNHIIAKLDYYKAGVSKN